MESETKDISIARAAQDGKVFMDAVHGQFRVPKVFCSQIIDTPLFQRLRRIEQTLVSSLFPSATHNRFIHSLGVFHVGMEIVNTIDKSPDRDGIKDTLKGISEGNILTSFPNLDKIDKYEILIESYLIACLLHDCGHAPFSHTFEGYYSAPSPNEAGNLGDELLEDIVRAVKDLPSEYVSEGTKSLFCDELKEASQGGGRAKNHEYVGAWLCIHKHGFLERILSKEICADPLLVCRMIIGLTYNIDATTEATKDRDARDIINSFIRLLNGHVIDADKIDYTLRDSWATGISACLPNIHRLISAIRITNIGSGRYRIVYKKQALTEIQSLKQAKVHNNYWLFNHHKFKFLESQLIIAVEHMATEWYRREYGKQGTSKTDRETICESGENRTASDEKETSETDRNAICELIDYKHLVENKANSCNAGSFIPYLTDDDIYSLLKKIVFSLTDAHPARKAYQAWVTRGVEYVALWKSYPEYHVYMKDIIDFLDKKNLDNRKNGKTHEGTSISDIACYATYFCSAIYKLFFIRNNSSTEKWDNSYIVINGVLYEGDDKKCSEEISEGMIKANEGIEILLNEKKTENYDALPIPKSETYVKKSYFYVYVHRWLLECIEGDKDSLLEKIQSTMFNLQEEEIGKWIEISGGVKLNTR